MRSFSSVLTTRDRNVTMMEINNNLLMARLQDRRRDGGDGVSCKHPVLDIFDEAIMKFFPPSPKPDCPSEPPWVHLRGDKVVVDQNLVRERYIRCIFSEVLRETEDLNRQGPVYSTDKEHKFRLSDFVVVGCTDRHENKWGSVIAGGWRNEKVVSTTGWQLLSPDGLPVNVLIWGYDSISRNTFIRKLPKTYDFLIEALGGMVLKGYNIVGDGTARAIIPMMTGKTEIELPDARRRMGDAASSVDVYPFIWKKFKSRGYVTGYLDDRPEIGTFQLNLKGFNKTPTDLYTRPLYLTRERLGLTTFEKVEMLK
ncbi:unnamed protein product [Notodromas monacha]|uniref:Uncharacterized protein n=1 Tax=Notodromas monacha TaxID=399045 RepID=A0A7R9BWR6_9CRUS|nr:unnamed protein product [Notodromas monacha]CAG0921824.1 unnamed protein product [Notodromas monacha]